jgi:hypothetical protein
LDLSGVPPFPDFRKVTLSDKGVVSSCFSEHPTEVSERTFGSIFMWRLYEDRSMLSQLDGHLLVSWRREKFGSLLLEPIGPEPARVVSRLAELSRSSIHGYKGVFGLVEPVVSFLRAEGLEAQSLRDEWDYVYATRDLARLEGPAYHTQRKEMKKATSQYELAYEPMTPEHREACLALEETWCDMKSCTLEKFSSAEDLALKQALENMNEIDFFGGVVLMEGKVQALTLGERLNDRTAAVHFEKANPGIRGLYQVINQQFCEKALGDFEFVNREQDVGEPGLRRAKEGYHPHHFVEKQLLSFA